MSLTQKELIRKYNVPVPRYTSYPTVPFWDTEKWNEDQWIEKVKITHKESSEGISLYIHLPFCESLCTYCGCNKRITKNHDVELPYIQDVLKEWDLYKQHLGKGITIGDIHLGGGTPTFFTPENLKFLITTLLADLKISPRAEFSFEAHPANTTIEHLKTLFSLGFRRLSLGVQDFDPLVQFIINRKQSEEDIFRVMNQAQQLGYSSINFDLIYGLPKQTLATVENTVNKVIALKPDRISFYSYAHVPWLQPGQRHYDEKDLPKDEEKLQLYELGKQMILEAGYEDIGMDHFALPGDALFKAFENETLHRNFMGYTDRFSPLMIGLGVSSISDSWNAFAQNVKSVEEYRSLLAQNKLPLLKGHIHNTEDLVFRKHILNIMCEGRTSWEASNTPDNINELTSLSDDGLIILKANGLEITPLGKSFLRNICMPFDQRLRAKQPGTNIFSNAI
ncbi:oxygen-independent coproporphyrinogen III oxidase [Albibacterium bauzanense]|uniref:Coproporphyrinogen-III oxidase n=1 Tax=Albibacterium bauzanense TaxID=653929 RepID=A0A4R1M358_9SPHI|nr:oxygen-independent coproporphyrinogen III oxidase [Albibacterium bauzanense]TCK85662.1 oxygen-independent coproporphyrinogen-3 oxidase [Albibacterium bauzanense]